MNNLVTRSGFIIHWTKLLKPQSLSNISSYKNYSQNWPEGEQKPNKQDSNNFSSQTKLGLGALSVVGVGVGSYIFYKYGVSDKNTVQLASYAPKTEPNPLANNSNIPIRKQFGVWRKDLPTYSVEDIQAHDSVNKRVWTIFKEGVYDITDYIPNHPGSIKNIMMAAGNSVEPFWKTFGGHFKQEILELLESYRIGNIKLEDSQKLMEGVIDPYENEPRRSQLLHPASMKPFNAEPYPTKLLVESFYTPNECFYVRNHLPVAHVTEEEYQLEVDLDDCDQKMIFTLADIKKLPKYEVDATIMCAGNRRSEATKVKPLKGLNWGVGAIGNAKWGGARLRDVLSLAGVKDEDPRFRHVHFHGYDTDPTSTPYDVSIPIHKAMDKYGDVILAYEMNGSLLPIDHGFPIRVVAPGICGARHVKWLNEIIVHKKESEGYWQAKDYKGFNPTDTWETADFEKAEAIQALPVISAICVPEVNESIACDVEGYMLVKGYAYSGGGNKIIRVDVTPDRGETWTSAELQQNNDLPPRHYSWTLWTAKVPIRQLGNFQMELWVKAVDSNYNTQPENFENIWNIRGVLNNAYHKVPVHAHNTKIPPDPKYSKED